MSHIAIIESCGTGGEGMREVIDFYRKGCTRKSRKPY